MDVDAPLGVDPRVPSRRRLLLAAAVGLGLVAAATIGFILATADPRGGEPSAVASLAGRPVAARTPSTDPTPTGSLAPSAGGTLNASRTATAEPGQFDGGTVENGVRVFRGTEPGGAMPAAATHGPAVIDVTRQLDASPRKAHVSTGNAGPSSAPANPVMPRIAIYIGGMGLSPEATRTAIDSMPQNVTLAFVPNGPSVAGSVDAAKAKGHEILLQLPMQNAQGTTSGSHALRPDEAADAVGRDLDWLMSRFSGYVGVTNLLGGPVTASAVTMERVLKDVAARNLFYVDDGTSKRSVAPALARQLNVAAGEVDVVLDATADPAIVRANLDSLVAVARRKGHAIGMASGLPDHLSTIARFAAELPSKNIALVSVGALCRRDANLATMAR